MSTDGFTLSNIISGDRTPSMNWIGAISLFVFLLSWLGGVSAGFYSLYHMIAHYIHWGKSRPNILRALQVSVRTLRTRRLWETLPPASAAHLRKAHRGLAVFFLFLGLAFLAGAIGTECGEWRAM